MHVLARQATRDLPSSDERESGGDIWQRPTCFRLWTSFTSNGGQDFWEGALIAARRAAMADSDAVECHFEAEAKPRVIHLHWVKDEVIPARGSRATNRNPCG